MKVKFKDITDAMAEILAKKNDAYNNSFDSTMEKWGLTAVGIRTDDKKNRIDQMIKDGNYMKNGEGLLDNLFDLAGYSVLAIRYLVNSGKLSEEDVRKYFNEDTHI